MRRPGDGGSLLLLPHYRPHPQGLATVGGRIVRLEPALRRLAEFCRTERGRAEVEAFFGTADASIPVERLVAAGILLELPPPSPTVPAGGPDLVLSPHVDDAALSLGASIVAARDRNTLVLNVFSRQSYQTGLRAPRAALDSLAEAEDALAGRKLGYRRRNLGLQGAQDRHGLPHRKLFGWTRGAILAEPVLRREIASLADTFGCLAEADDHPRLFAPAAIGGHLDHAIVALAAARLLDRGRISPDRLVFYEDLPYAAGGMAGGILPEGFAERIEDVTGTLAEKLAALAVFRTRLRAPQIALCGRHAAALGTKGRAGERQFVHRAGI